MFAVVVLERQAKCSWAVRGLGRTQGLGKVGSWGGDEGDGASAVSGVMS